MIKLKNIINEIDWDKFSDVRKRCISPEEIEKMLNTELERLKGPKNQREKRPIDIPIIAPGNIPVDDKGKVIIKDFLIKITRKPPTIFDEGVKSAHSSTELIQTINTGIPALKSVLWDEENRKFYIINTCPGAGQCISACYAMSGFYIFISEKNLKLINRLQLLMNKPEQYEKQAYNECELYALKAKQENKTLEIRWNDAGDFFTDVYFNIAVKITHELLSKGYDVQSYAYTKVGKYVKLGTDKGMTMSFSSGANQKEKEKINYSSNKVSDIVPRSVYSKFLFPISKGFERDSHGKPKFRDEINGRNELKHAIVNYYKNNKDFQGVTMDNLKYTDELPSAQGNPLQYNTIILPVGDSDSPAQRKDVKYIFLLQH